MPLTVLLGNFTERKKTFHTSKQNVYSSSLKNDLNTYNVIYCSSKSVISKTLASTKKKSLKFETPGLNFQPSHPGLIPTSVRKQINSLLHPERVKKSGQMLCLCLLELEVGY